LILALIVPAVVKSLSAKARLSSPTVMLLSWNDSDLNAVALLPVNFALMKSALI